MQVTHYDEANHIQNGTIAVSEKSFTGRVPAHNHNFYEIELFLTPGGSYTVDGKTYPIEAGSLFFLSPASFHDCTFLEGTRLFNIMFTMDLADISLLYRIFSEDSYFYQKITSENEFSFFTQACSLMVQYTSEKQPLSFTAPLLNSILGRIYFLSETEKSTYGDISPIQRAALYIQSHFDTDITLEELSELAGLSPGYFCDRFHAQTGTSFKKYLLNLRLSYAKKLLKYTDLSITEIALESGFNDASHFMHTFKKALSKTPRQYRTENTP